MTKISISVDPRGAVSPEGVRLIIDAAMKGAAAGEKKAKKMKKNRATNWPKPLLHIRNYVRDCWVFRLLNR